MERVFVWGAGGVAGRLLDGMDSNVFSVIGLIDNNKDKQGQLFHGYRVYSPDVLSREPFDRIIITSHSYEAIYNQILTLCDMDKDMIKDWRYTIKKNLQHRYRLSSDPEIKQIIKYLDKHELREFNYQFAEKYYNMPVDIKFDDKNSLFYVIYKGKRMYFSKSLDTSEKIHVYYRSVCLEQDPMSPHAYFDNQFTVDEGDVVVDVGVAEGNFSLDIIDKVSKLYIVEGDSGWVEALKLTFKDYSDKVVIIDKFVSDIKDGNYETLDNLINEPVNFIKMDVEGYECLALKGATKLFELSEELKCCICAYHKENAEEDIKRILADYGMKVTTTKGYMWFPEPGDRYATDLRRGVIRGER